jgi:xanthine/CO dehydrogenase XdhC/CoxF family maturation factor
VAHILIATANMKARRALSDVLVAVGHHVITTTEARLGLAILRLSQYPLIVLVGEELASREGVRGLRGQGLLDLVLDDDADADQTIPWVQRTQHAYILLTHTPAREWTASARALLERGGASVLPPDCLIGALLNAIEDASERLVEQREVDLLPAMITG